ncbi:Rhs family protein [Cellulophaga geojensis KL-A]|uniref:Rhs family protein n=1 Tax=Cellulophaga geojensis KL-A TaxID=1328323 RepID=A0ABN0RK87_9FLAO|nr:DUF2380 domain-containing protein [Cellulophaga geojensis]EWH11439.1 Rhs family protein [Cellulophaga geojensis KL-A]
MPLKGCTTSSGMSRASSNWLKRYGPSAMRDHHLIPQEMLKDKKFMNQLDKLTKGNGADYLHRQISTITNELHNTIHKGAKGGIWNKQFKDWAKNKNFNLTDLQRQLKKMMKDHNLPKSSRNFAKKYKCG